MKYALIKWYPSLPKHFEERDVVEKCARSARKGDDYYYKRLSKCSVLDHPISIDEVQNNPEFWGLICDNCGKLKKEGEQIKNNRTDCLCEKVVNLNVPVGTKFRISDRYDQIFEISGISKNKVGVQWIDHNNVKHCVDYPIKSVNTYFIQKQWVIEKDYEILSYISKLKNCIIKPKNPLFNNGEWDIHSVKRLSDGEVFTVGDKLYLRDNRPNEPLAEFKIIDGKIRAKAQFQINLNHSWGSSYTLDYLKHTTKPLFTTEDVYEIFEGDEYKFISNDFKIITDTAIKSSGKSSTLKYFKKKENAQKWIEDNKPQYSKKNIENAFGKYSSIYKEDLIVNLEKLNK